MFLTSQMKIFSMWVVSVSLIIFGIIYDAGMCDSCIVDYPKEFYLARQVHSMIENQRAQANVKREFVPKRLSEPAEEACSFYFIGEEAEKCEKVILSSMWKETGETWDCSLVGDDGRSFGCLQVQTELHSYSVESAVDPEKVTWFWCDWMKKKLDSGASWKQAVMSWNGSGEAADSYASEVLRKSEDF